MFFFYQKGNKSFKQNQIPHFIYIFMPACFFCFFLAWFKPLGLNRFKPLGLNQLVFLRPTLTLLHLVKLLLLFSFPSFLVSSLCFFFIALTSIEIAIAVVSLHFAMAFKSDWQLLVSNSWKSNKCRESKKEKKQKKTKSNNFRIE